MPLVAFVNTANQIQPTLVDARECITPHGCHDTHTHTHALINMCRSAHVNKQKADEDSFGDFRHANAEPHLRRGAKRKLRV